LSEDEVRQEKVTEGSTTTTEGSS